MAFLGLFIIYWIVHDLSPILILNIMALLNVHFYRHGQECNTSVYDYAAFSFSKFEVMMHM